MGGPSLAIWNRPKERCLAPARDIVALPVADTLEGGGARDGLGGGRRACHRSVRVRWMTRGASAG